MKRKIIILTFFLILFIFIIYVIGGNLYIKSQIRKNLHTYLSDLADKLSTNLASGEKVEIKVKKINTDFCPLPFFSPYVSAKMEDISLIHPKFEISMHELKGSAKISERKVKTIYLKSLKNISFKDKKYGYRLGIKSVNFSPHLRLSSTKILKRTSGGEINEINLTYQTFRMDIQKIIFSEKLNIPEANIKELPSQLSQGNYLINKINISYTHPINREKIKIYFPYLKLKGDLEKEKNSSNYILSAYWETQLSQINLPKSLKRDLKKEKINIKPLLPLKMITKFEFTNLSKEMINSYIKMLNSLQTIPKDEEKQAEAIMKFFISIFPYLGDCYFNYELRFLFPEDTCFEIYYTTKLKELLDKIQGKKPEFITLRIKNRSKFIELFSQVGLKDKEINEFLSKFECKNEICTYKVKIEPKKSSKLPYYKKFPL